MAKLVKVKLLDLFKEGVVSHNLVTVGNFNHPTGLSMADPVMWVFTYLSWGRLVLQTAIISLQG